MPCHAMMAGRPCHLGRAEAVRAAEWKHQTNRRGAERAAGHGGDPLMSPVDAAKVQVPRSPAH